MMGIGERIRCMRKEGCLTLADVADKLGMTAAGLSLLELGKRRVSAEQIEVFAPIFGVEPSEFFGRELNGTATDETKEASANA